MNRVGDYLSDVQDAGIAGAAQGALAAWIGANYGGNPDVRVPPMVRANNDIYVFNPFWGEYASVASSYRLCPPGQFPVGFNSCSSLPSLAPGQIPSFSWISGSGYVPSATPPGTQPDFCPTASPGEVRKVRRPDGACACPMGYTLSQTQANANGEALCVPVSQGSSLVDPTVDVTGNGGGVDVSVTDPGTAEQSGMSDGAKTLITIGAVGLGLAGLYYLMSGKSRLWLASLANSETNARAG